MAVKHKKTAGAARQSDPAIIDGPDWDDDHLYGIGSVFTLGFVEVNYYQSTNTINVTGTRVTGSSLGAGQINITLDMSGLPISAADDYNVHVIGQQMSLNSNLQWQASVGQNGAGTLTFIQSGSSALPSASFWARLMVSVEVVPA